MGFVVLGFGGHGRDIAATLLSKVDGFYDDAEMPGRFGTIAAWAPNVHRAAIIGINDPHQRADIARRLPADTLGWVHPRAILGPGMSPYDLVNRNVHVNAGVTITRTSVGEFTTIAPGATICGDVTIGQRVLIGAGAVICQFASIGDDAVIGAGAIVLPHAVVPAGETWVGNPARCIKSKVST